MSKIDDFKLFVKGNPKLINYVRSNEMTWQKFYEMYDIYGSDNEIWNEYTKDNNNDVGNESSSKSGSVTSFSDIVNMAKNMDVEKVQEGITSLQKAISLFSDLFIKNEVDTNKSGYTPRPIYRSFED